MAGPSDSCKVGDTGWQHPVMLAVCPGWPRPPTCESSVHVTHGPFPGTRGLWERGAGLRRRQCQRDLLNCLRKKFFLVRPKFSVTVQYVVSHAGSLTVRTQITTF